VGTVAAGGAAALAAPADGWRVRRPSGGFDKMVTRGGLMTVTSGSGVEGCASSSATTKSQNETHEPQ